MDRSGSVSASPELLGDRYQLEVCLGAGGMGSVWRAYDRRMQRHVAIKRLLRQEPEAAQRFEREMRTLARLRHPNLVSVFDTGTTAQGDPYLVMELVPGYTLAERIRQVGRLPVEQASRIAHQIARGLNAAHAEGVVHRDLKPSNIMLGDEYGEPDCVKLLDFGVSRLVDATQQSLSGDHFIGTPLYASPEQAKGEEATPSSDLYCLGTVLYEMLVGHPPFRAETAMGVLFQHAHAVPPTPSHEQPGIPAWLDELILKLLHKQQQARPTAQSVLAYLDTEPVAEQRRATPPASVRSPPASAIREPHAASTRQETTISSAAALAATQPRAIQAGSEAPPADPRSDKRPSWLGKAPKGTVLWAPAAIGFAALGLLALVSPFPGAPPKAPARNAPGAIAPIVVDDFEAADVRPSGPLFSVWEGYLYTYPIPMEELWFPSWFWKVRAPNSKRALRFGWRASDPPNGKVDNVGVVLQVRAANDFVDLSRHSRMVLTLRYDADVGWPGLDPKPPPELEQPIGESIKAIPQGHLNLLEAEFSVARLEQCSHSSAARLSVTFHCREHESSSWAFLEVSSSWKTIVIPFSDLQRPPWRESKDVPREVCLSVVDLISFGMPTGEIEDGACHSGAMLFDDISIR